jgi:hypothetical protein
LWIEHFRRIDPKSSRKIDSEGVQRVNGKTFRWSGEYSWDLNTPETRSIALNVFEHFIRKGREKFSASRACGVVSGS